MGRERAREKDGDRNREIYRKGGQVGRKHREIDLEKETDRQIGSKLNIEKE